MCQPRPIFPGRCQPSMFGTTELNYRVRNGNGWTLRDKGTDFYVGDDLFFRAVASQVCSAQRSLTAVFGKGTGGPSAIKSPTERVKIHSQPKRKQNRNPNELPKRSSSPRSISIVQLNTLLCLHLRPIKHVVCM